MARTLYAVVVVAYHCIYLKRAGSAIMPVVLRHVPPVDRYISKYPQTEHDKHANAKYQRPMNTAAGSWFLFLILVLGCSLCLRWRRIMDNVLFISTSDNLRCCLRCCVADRAFWRPGRPHIFILF